MELFLYQCLPSRTKNSDEQSVFTNLASKDPEDSAAKIGKNRSCGYQEIAPRVAAPAVQLPVLRGKG